MSGFADHGPRIFACIDLMFLLHFNVFKVSFILRMDPLHALLAV